ncbi:MAG: aldolase/citrate lyase family protein [Gemmataceae bacterium]
MKGRDIRQALRAGHNIFSSAITAPCPSWPELLRRARVDFVFIDSEHTPLGREMLAWMCRAFSGIGIPPVVRIPSPDPFEATKVLDGGAGGIIGPYVETAEQVQALAGAARWRPLKGQRLQQALRDPRTLEPELRDYLEERNADTILIVNIESVPAIANLDQILAVPGLDAVLIGPHDLSCSLGIPEQYTHPRFDEAVRQIFRKAREYNVGAGIHFWESLDREIEWARAGGNLIMHSSDVAIFGQNLRREIETLRTALLTDSAGGGDRNGDLIV